MRSLRPLLVLGTLGLLALLAVARLGTWRSPWPVPLLDTFALYAFVPFIGVAVAAPLMRSRALGLLGLVALLFFGQQYGSTVGSAIGLTSRTSVAAPAANSQVRILTLNVQAPNDDPQLLLGLIRDHRPDLLLLQEVTTGYAQALEQAIGADYPFSYAAGLETEHEGAGTWSRLPLADPQPFRLSAWGNQLHRVRVSTARGDLWLYNVPLPNPTDPTNTDHERGRLAAMWAFDASRRDAELEDLMEGAAAQMGPVILAGDFNLAAGSRAYRDSLAGWHDAFGEAGQGFGHTYPVPDHDHEGEPRQWLKRPFALLRIDYVLTRGDLRPTRAWTEVMVDSDHLALLTDLDLSDAPN